MSDITDAVKPYLDDLKEIKTILPTDLSPEAVLYMAALGQAQQISAALDRIALTLETQNQIAMAHYKLMVANVENVPTQN